MITLYLDHQVYTYLKKNEDNPELFKKQYGVEKQALINKLRLFLTQHKNNFLIFYSQAHLLDLTSDKSGNKERLLSDLKYRGEWAEDNYLIFQEKEKTTDYQLAYPEEAFEPYWEEQEEIDFSNLFDLSKFEGFANSEELDDLKGKLQILENLKFPSIEEIIPEEVRQKEDFKKMQEWLPFLSGKSFTESLNEFMSFAKRMQEEKGVYKGLRNAVTSGVLKSKQLSNTALIPVEPTLETKFMIDLANTDLNSPEKETFVKKNLLDLVKKQWAARNNGKEPNQFNLHYESYFMLDIMGIEKEEATIARNMLHDAQHSFYGGHCEVVVSDDKQFRAKSKLLYKLFGLSTQVLSIKEFMKQSFGMELEEVNTASDLILRARTDLSTRFISSDKITPLFNRVRELKPSMKYLHYFNQILLVNEDGKDYIVFRHINDTYKSPLPFKIIKEITDKSFKLFGIDDQGRSIYRWEDENQEIREGKKQRRQWTLGESTLSLQLSPKGGYLQLVIE